MIDSIIKPTGSFNRRDFAKATAATVAASSLSMTGLVAPAFSQEKLPKAEKLDNRLYFLTIDGSPYDRGLQHGQALRYVIQRGIATWKQWISEFLEQPNPEVEIAEFVQGTDYMGAIRKHTPDLYPELQGIAAGANVNLNDLYAYNMFDEFLSFTVQKFRLGFCSGFGVYGRSNLPNIIGQNNDLPRFFDGTQTLLRIKEADGRQIYAFTFAGLLANNGLNSACVGCTINIMPTRLSGALDGLPMPYVVRGILACQTRREAVEFVKGVGKYAGPMDYIIGDPTGVTVVETGKDFFKIHETYKGEKYIPHTNHPLEMTAEMKPGEASKSLKRLKKLEELLSGRVDDIDVSETRKIFRTPPLLKNYETDPTFPTLESIIIELDPANPRLQIAPGPPDRYKYHSFDFNQGFIETES
jgi:isopenicillin-N N-acyltransferase-like protein